MSLRISVLLLTLAFPATAQLVGASLGRVSATVDWQYPRPSANCDFCIVDVSPNASRESLAPAFMWQSAPGRAVGFASELRYTRKGYATTEPTLNVHYLEIPTFLRLGAISASALPIRPFLEVGPAFALRVHCEVNYNRTSDPCERGVAFGQDWRVRHFDVSGILGIGLAVSVGEDIAILGARYDYGFVNIGSTGEGVPTKNRSSLVYLGWLWPIRSAAH
jgi:hypothetical protein